MASGVPLRTFSNVLTVQNDCEGVATAAGGCACRHGRATPTAIGSPPVRVDTRRDERVESEAEHVREVYRDFLDGEPLMAMARAWREAGRDRNRQALPYLTGSPTRVPEQGQTARKQQALCWSVLDAAT